MGEPEASKIAVLFTVQVETGEDENMMLVGDTAELGKWCLHKGILLSRVSRNSSSSVSTWRVKVQVPVNINFQYRYAVVENCNPLNIEKLVVKRWEGFSIRRSGSTKFQSEKFVKNNDGLIHEVHLKTDRFGLSGGADEENVIDRGFLTCQTEVHLRFHSAVEYPLVLFGKESPSQFNITIKQFDSVPNQKSEDCWKASHIIAKKLTDFHCQEFCNHRENGCNIRDGEYVVFTTQILDFKKLVLEVAVKSISVDGCPSLILGQTVVVGSQLKGSVGTLVAPLTKDMIPVGHLLVDYLVVKPFKHPSVLDMEHSPAAYWNHKNTPVYIGHRGLGSSFHCARPAYLTENTIGSFTRAHEVGADYVEFDVLLTEDGVPVVYHDFDTDVFVGKNTEMIKMEVKDLTLKQLELLKPPDQDENVAVDGETTVSNSGIGPSDRALKSKLFPTLQEVFQHTPPSLHFDVELKYPVYYVNDIENREAGAIDMNKYVDTVLQTVFENAGDRNLLFSIFDPDVCTMLRLKQHRYPVVLLTCGINDIWTMYRDVRSRSVAMGTSFVLSEGIIGLGMFSTPLLKDPWKVQKAREAGIQVMLTWGDENIDVNARQRLKEMGLDGIMCDRIYEANLEPPDKRQKRE